ncbi:hypothetical protein [Leptospira sp. id769339]|uniref:hypothetical protein n=1 Tax=Leptospira sp. id769339 TaxID=2864221 RepID=UPI00214B9D53|nr:hypothetical protein [Leptospira sp. id769339]MCR1795820.1 hypothetical protein [Leptospira sp. id769339]
MELLKNLLIGRKFKLESTQGFLRLYIKDRGTYKYIYIIIYATLSAYVFNSFSTLGIFISILVFVFISILLYHSYSPFKKERFIQIAEDGITLSEGMTFTSFSGILKWNTIKRVEKVKYYNNVSRGYATAGPFYKFTLKYNKEIELYCIFPRDFEREFIKAFQERKIALNPNMAYLKPSIIA